MISASRLPAKGGKWFGGIFMNALHTILTIIQVILAVGLVVIVTIQSGKSAGLSGAIAGGNGDTYLGKNKNKGLDAKLALATKWVGGVFIVLTSVSYTHLTLPTNREV